MAASLKLIEKDDTLPPPLTGEEIMAEVAALIEQHLPSLPIDDPYRGALHAFACVGSTKRRARMSRQRTDMDQLLRDVVVAFEEAFERPDGRDPLDDLAARYDLTPAELFTVAYRHLEERVSNAEDAEAASLAVRLANVREARMQTTAADA